MFFWEISNTLESFRGFKILDNTQYLAFNQAFLYQNLLMKGPGVHKKATELLAPGDVIAKNYI